MKDIILKNWPLKLLALFTAIFLWSYVVNEGYRVNFVDTVVPVEAYNLSEDLALAEDLTTANLNIRVPNTLTTIGTDEIRAFVDLKGLKAGEHTVNIVVSFKNPDIKLIEIDKEQIVITLEPLQTITKEFEIETIGLINENYELQDPEFNLKEVEIKGSTTSLEKINKIVAPVKLSGEQTEIKSLVELEARDIDNNKITNLVIIPKTIEATIPVRKNEEVKTVGIKANLKGNPAPGYWIKQISFDPSTVAINGEFEKVNNLEYLNTASVDIEGISSDRQQTVSLELPEGLQTVNSEGVKMNIVVASETTSKDVNSTLSFKNINKKLVVSATDPDNSTISIEGPTPELNSINNLVALIDLAGKSEGSFTITLEPSMFSLPTGVSIKKYSPTSINITIKTK